MSRCTVDDWASDVPDRKLDEVRRTLGGPHPAVPADLSRRAEERGRRLLHRRRVLHGVLLALAVAALIAFTVLAILTWPWNGATPPETAPPVTW
ncbi:hypothetical protein [Wenjunlia tyrosinilytica]|jgi:hypothetical protein|nr:hypothetical protein [Wenjunlia tyrosinilytica]